MISKQDIKQLSDLARIEVSDAEAEHLQADLERILAYVEQLERAETGSADPLWSASMRKNVMRGDNPENGQVESNPADLVGAAPERDNGFVKVKPIWKQ